MQDETRIIKVLEFGVSYIRDFTVIVCGDNMITNGVTD